MLLFDFMLTFIEELDDTATCKTVPDGISNDKTDVQVQLKKIKMIPI